jgi:hypothetical protein
VTAAQVVLAVHLNKVRRRVPAARESSVSLKLARKADNAVGKEAGLGTYGDTKLVRRLSVSSDPPTICFT